MRFKNILVKTAFLVLNLIFLGACTKSSSSDSGKVVWVYTSLYKDTIADMTPYLKKAFPDVEVKWFQAGSEEIAAKVNAEILSGNLQADLLLCSDRFWYEELAN